jgi:hypothetical protein
MAHFFLVIGCRSRLFSPAGDVILGEYGRTVFPVGVLGKLFVPIQSTTYCPIPGNGGICFVCIFYFPDPSFPPWFFPLVIRFCAAADSNRLFTWNSRMLGCLESALSAAMCNFQCGVNSK